VGSDAVVGSDESRPVVSNTTPLIVLARLGLLDILPALCGEVDRRGGLARALGWRLCCGSPLGSLTWLRRVTGAALVDEVLTKHLDAGEAVTIALAEHVGARVVLLGGVWSPVAWANYAVCHGRCPRTAYTRSG
jgi:predicted nucleic acid-binding protein